MSDLLPFVVAGLVTGSLYGLAGMGLVLTYKTSGVFNFAHGAVGTLAAYVFFELHVQRDMPWPVAATLVVVVLGVAIGFALERLARALAVRTPAMQIVATVGLLITIQSLVVAWWGAQSRAVRPYLPTGTFRVAGVNVGSGQLIVVLVALVLAAGLYSFFRSSRLGLSMQAVVDDPDLLATGGTSPVRVRTIAWIIGAVFACLSGVLLVPFMGLDATILTLLVVQAFGAAAIGGFDSLPLTYLGGLVVGVTASLSTKFIGQVEWLAGFPSAVPFLTLFVVLLVLPKHRLRVISPVRVRVRPLPSVSPRAKATGSLVAGVGLLAVPHLVGPRLPVYTSGLILVAVFLSLHLLVRVSGQVSLAHAAFAAVGGAAFAHLAAGGDLPWLVALVAGGLLAVPIGAAVAIPAIRLSGLYLAVATFGFGILLERLVYPTGIMFGSTFSSAVSAPRPEVWSLSGDTGYYYTVLVLVTLLAVLTAAVLRSRLGRLLRALSDSPVALSTHGTSVNLTRLLVFCISAFMAGIAGALTAGLNLSITVSTFTFFDSLEWLVVMVIAGALVHYAPLPTALVGAAALAVIPSYFQSGIYHEYFPVLFGLVAIAHALASDRPPPALHREAEPERGARIDERRRSPVAERTAGRRDARPRRVEVGV